MVIDLVLDTHILNEFIAQYFENQVYSNGCIEEASFIDKNRAKRLNQIIEEYKAENTFSHGLIVASVIGFIEIARKFKNIVQNRYSILQFRAFIEQSPPYFEIAPLEHSLSYHLFKIPKAVYINKVKKPIELPDAIHCATYLSRDSAMLMTNDGRIHKIENIKFG
jgi:hypothetical protein